MHRDFAMAELMSYILVSPLIKAVAGLSVYDSQCSPENTGILPDI